MALAEGTGAGLRSAWEIAIDIFAPTPQHVACRKVWTSLGCLSNVMSISVRTLMSEKLSLNHTNTPFLQDEKCFVGSKDFLTPMQE